MILILALVLIGVVIILALPIAGTVKFILWRKRKAKEQEREAREKETLELLRKQNRAV